jgi:hypothetical protein
MVSARRITPESALVSAQAALDQVRASQLAFEQEIAKQLAAKAGTTLAQQSAVAGFAAAERGRELSALVGDRRLTAAPRVARPRDGQVVPKAPRPRR